MGETHHPSAITHLSHPGLYLASRPQLLVLSNSKITVSISKYDFSESGKMKYFIFKTALLNFYQLFTERIDKAFFPKLIHVSQLKRI